jgi:hypothetical protein
MAKKRRRTNDDVINSYVDNYRVMVNRGASMREVVEYGLEKKQLVLPTAKSGKEVLIQRFTRAQSKQMSFDEVLKQSYNTNVWYLVGDEVHWIKQADADKEHFMYSNHQKRKMAVGILTSIERNRRHWNRTHEPDEQIEPFENDLGPDVLWNLGESDGEEETGTND